MSQDTKRFTPEELATFDGKDGRPAYVAYKGRVIDVSLSRLWKAGKHMNRHQAGTDLTVDLSHAPHAEDVLDRCPQVGVLAGAVERTAPVEDELPWLLRKNPFLRRHPHPMTVHFPIAFAFGALASLALYLWTGMAAFAGTVHGCCLLGLLFTPVAILTGLATWKYNYGLASIRPVVIKLALSPVLLAQFAAASAWWLVNPGVLLMPGPDTWAFAGLLLSMQPVMGVIGWYGAGLTFPMHAE